MPRLIEAEELKHILNNSKYYGTKAGNAFADMITECKTIEERKKGKWIYRTEITCSVCGSATTFDDNFCSHCGADMRGDGYDN